MIKAKMVFLVKESKKSVMNELNYLLTVAEERNEMDVHSEITEEIEMMNKMTRNMKTADDYDLGASFVWSASQAVDKFRNELSRRNKK